MSTSAYIIIIQKVSHSSGHVGVILGKNPQECSKFFALVFGRGEETILDAWPDDLPENGNGVRWATMRKWK
jgi:hypothetical protein